MKKWLPHALLVVILLIYGPYLIIYLGMSLFMMLISSTLKNNGATLSAGTGLAVATLLLNAYSPFTYRRFNNLNPLYHTTFDMACMNMGTNPDPMIWGLSSLILIGLLTLLYMSIRRLWGGARV